MHAWQLPERYQDVGDLPVEATDLGPSGGDSTTCACGTALAAPRGMKRPVIVTALVALLAGCHTKDDCGSPFGCTEEKRGLTSHDVGDLLGIEEPVAAVLLDETGHVPKFDEANDELIYQLSEDELDALAMAAD